MRGLSLNSRDITAACVQGSSFLRYVTADCERIHGVLFGVLAIKEYV